MRFLLLISLMATAAAMHANARALSAAWWPRAIFNEIVARAGENPDLQAGALLLLREAAEGQGERITDAMLLPFGIGREYVQNDAIKSLEVRTLAYLAIGRLSNSGALEYLASVHIEQFSDEERTALSEPIRSAIYMARLGQISDRERRVEFLVDIVRTKRTDYSAKVPVGWAEDELCRMGAVAFLPEVEASIKRDTTSWRSESRSLLCREKMRVAASQPSRTATLASALRSKNTLENGALLTWVINELAELRTTESWRALEQFAREARQTHGQAIRQTPIFRHVDYVELCLTTRFH